MNVEECVKVVVEEFHTQGGYSELRNGPSSIYKWDFMNPNNDQRMRETLSAFRIDINEYCYQLIDAMQAIYEKADRAAGPEGLDRKQDRAYQEFIGGFKSLVNSKIGKRQGGQSTTQQETQKGGQPGGGAIPEEHRKLQEDFQAGMNNGSVQRAINNFADFKAGQDLPRGQQGWNWWSRKSNTLYQVFFDGRSYKWTPIDPQPKPPIRESEMHGKYKMTHGGNTLWYKMDYLGHFYEAINNHAFAS